MDYRLEDSLELGQDNLIKECFKHALSDTSRESCGIFIVNGENPAGQFLNLNNLNLQANNHFSLNEPLFFEHYLKKEILCLFHSHVIDGPEPSQLDIYTSRSLSIPSLIFSTQSKDFYLYIPENYKPPPLKSRAFIPILQDCIAFVRDFYLLNLDINLYKIIENWSRPRKEPNDYLIDNVSKHFVEIDFKDRKYGDLVIFTPSDDNLYHVGVVDDDDHIYHHPRFMLPCKEIISSIPKDKVYKCCRYKDL